MENEKKILKRYGFFGAPAYDYILYLAGILCNLRKKVLVVDRTKSHQILSLFLWEEDEDVLFQYKHVDYTKSLCLASEIETNYDYVFCYEEDTCMEEMSYEGLLLCSDYQKENLKAAECCAKKVVRPGVFLLRDACVDKLDEAFLYREFPGLDSMYLDMHIIPLDVIDYGYRLKMKYESYQGFAHLSKEYKQSLMKVVEELEQPATIAVRQAYQKAERGKYHGSRILE